MTFLNPLMLLALAAAAIPVLVHLLNLRRPRRVDFSSLAFVKELKQSTMQRVRIKNWLLLLLRVLAIACLVMAFARPTLTGRAGGTLGQRPAASSAVVVDNSLSMTLRDAQGAYLEQAKALANRLAGEMQQGDELSVLTTAGADDPAPYTTAAPAQDAVAALEAQPGARTLAESAQRAARVLGRAAHPNRTVYLLSDAQQSTLLDSLAGGGLSAEEDVRVRLLPVGGRAHANVAVTAARVESRIIEAGQPAQVEATLKNFGEEALTGYVASVFLGDERVAQATADLPPGASRTVQFTVTPQERGWLAGRIETESDDFETDNTRYFALHVPERRRVLVVRGEGATTRYVELALSPDLTGGRVAFAAETIPETRLAGTPLPGYDAVVLVGPQSLSSGERSSLVQYVNGGGGLLLFPGEGASTDDYNALLAALGGGAVQGFSGTLAADGGASGQRSIASFARADLEHPLFEGVFDESDQSGQIESPDLYRLMTYAPQSGTEQTLIDLTSGSPFLQEVRHGRGAALVMAVAPERAWSDLPVRGLFIPLLYRSMYYLSASESVAEAALTAGAEGELRVAGAAESGAPLRLVGPEGQEFTPDQRDLFGGVLLLTSPDMRTPGVYDVMQGETLVRRTALNLAAAESDPARAAPEEAAAQLGDALGTPVDVLDAASADRLTAVLDGERTGIEIWNVFLLLALAFLIAEMAVSRLYTPETTAEPVPA